MLNCMSVLLAYIGKMFFRRWRLADKLFGDGGGLGLYLQSLLRLPVVFCGLLWFSSGPVHAKGLKPILRNTTSFSALTLLVGSFDPQKPSPK